RRLQTQTNIILARVGPLGNMTTDLARQVDDMRASMDERGGSQRARDGQSGPPPRLDMTSFKGDGGLKEVAPNMVRRTGGVFSIEVLVKTAHISGDFTVAGEDMDKILSVQFTGTCGIVGKMVQQVLGALRLSKFSAGITNAVFAVQEGHPDLDELDVFVEG
ncbi:unnamed protein product, partial [Prorocentrum cordatum]